MFGDPVRNPKEWEVKKLKEISINILNGTTPNGGSQVYVKDGIVFFRSQNVWKNRLLLDDVAYIDDETHLKMRKSSLRNKDILITKTGRINTENSSLGRAAIFVGKDNSANINGHVYLIRLKKGPVHEFVLYILTTDEYREYIRKVCVGGIDKRQINKEHLEEFPIIFPPLDLQHRFATLFEFIEKQKDHHRAQLAELDHLFSSLQHRAFRGEL
jgi:type I restriction enzyme S subunit